MKQYWLLTMTMLFISISALAQNGRYSVNNKSAIKNYEQATIYYDSYRNDEALKELDKAIGKDPDFIEAYILKANICIDKNDLEGAVEQYHKAIAINPSFYPTSFYTLANIELGLGRYADAKQNYTAFLGFQGINSTLSSKANKRIADCDFALEFMKHPVPFDPVNLGDAINTEFDEYFPSITIDDSTFIFTRNRPDVSNPRRFHEDFYISRRQVEGWGKALNGGSELNTNGNEGVPNFSPDGKLLFFAACERSDGKGSCDLYYSRLRDGVWSKPLNLGYPVNTGAWESQPSFSSDGRTLYFIRGKITGDGIKEQDIYVTTISDEGKWSDPAKLGSNINTDGEEEFVYIHPDNQTLYFSSDGHIGMGKLDIYFSRKRTDGTWGDPINLGYPVNTFQDDRGMLVGPRGDVAYIASDRSGGKGGLDLYMFSLPENAKPLQVSYVKGVVTDAESGQPLFANYEIIELSSGKTIINSATDKYHGDFVACLTAGNNYSLNVSKEGYLFYSDHFTCDNPSDIKDAYVLNVKLKKAEVGGKVVLKNIFFDTNLFDLKTESTPELNKLLSFLNSNPTAKIEIGGHTDSTGDKRSNQLLSENRARSVYDYLVKNGITPDRIKYIGYGDSKPVADNTTEEGRALNRRTEFTITSM